MKDSSGRPDWRARTAEWFAARNLAFGALAAGVAPIVSALLPSAHGWVRVAVVAALVSLALTGFAIPAAKARIAERRAVSAEADAEATSVGMRVTLSHTMLPLLSYVISGIDPQATQDRNETLGGAVQGVLSAATKLCGGSAETRACWYRLENDQARGIEKLVPARHHGRTVKPSTEFCSNEARGVELMDMLARDHTELWPDLASEKPDGWKPTRNDTSYRAFLVVPVRTENQLFGMLTVDVDIPNVLGTADVYIAQLLGWILALALACTQQAIVEALPAPRLKATPVVSRSPTKR